METSYEREARLNVEDARRKAWGARERAEKTTKGPWTVDTDVFEEGEAIEIVVMGESPMEMMFTDATTVMPTGLDSHHSARETLNYRNGEFIAHARTDVPELADIVEALAEEVERLTAERQADGVDLGDLVLETKPLDPRRVRGRVRWTEPEPFVFVEDEREREERERVEGLETEVGELSRRVEEAQAESRRLSGRIEELEGALRFYADEGVYGYWPGGEDDDSEAVVDGGKKARAALSGGERGDRW